MHRRTVTLNSLGKNRESEIEEILAGIQGRSGGVLWTSETRAALRGGGKCVGSTIIDESPQR